jgi:2-oxoisovalerate dehydrogenase E2 component (dihydrolipoyl transacylase)
MYSCTLPSALNELKGKARESKLTNENLQNATFTISNIGVIGGTYMTPVIVPPQVAMGAVGKVQTLPRFDAQGAVQKADIMHVTWAADHRFLDGATLARFHTAFKRYVENPTLMLLHMK